LKEAEFDFVTWQQAQTNGSYDSVFANEKMFVVDSYLEGTFFAFD
jgi:hypothetical protein